MKIQTLGPQSGFMESKWPEGDLRNLFFFLPGPLRTLIHLPIQQPQQTCRLGAVCELLQGAGQLQPGSGGSGKASEGGDQAVESWGMRERWRVKMRLHLHRHNTRRCGEVPETVSKETRKRRGPGRQ